MGALIEANIELTIVKGEKFSHILHKGIANMQCVGA
jgi:hypothetical protein